MVWSTELLECGRGSCKAFLCQAGRRAERASRVHLAPGDLLAGVGRCRLESQLDVGECLLDFFGERGRDGSAGWVPTT